EPVPDLRLVEVDQRRLHLRVVAPDDLDELAVPGRTGIRSNNAVDRVLLRPDARQSQLDRHLTSVSCVTARAAPCGLRRRRRRAGAAWWAASPFRSASSSSASPCARGGAGSPAAPSSRSPSRSGGGATRRSRAAPAAPAASSRG